MSRSATAVARGAASRWWLAIIAMLVACIPLVLLLSGAAFGVLAGSGGPLTSDVIVVLGGDGRPRAMKASELWHAGVARDVVVAGDGDCTDIRDVLVSTGVPERRITMDCLSTDTWTNAAYSAPLLERAGASSAVLVTSWFHTARALRVFRSFCPGIRWTASATGTAPPAVEIFLGHDREAVLQETVKAAVYLVRGWLLPPGKPQEGRRCFVSGDAR